ncbi:MAG: hypothetical protein ABR589_07980 [Chthoniobacterales bacterium]
MRLFLCICAIASVARISFAEVPSADPCALISKEELSKILGEIKEGPKPKEGLMKEKQCDWTNVSGAWLTIGIYDAEKWSVKKMGANNPVDVQGLGEEAYSDKRGTDTELYVRKGKVALEVRTSAGSDVARKAAELAATKLQML